MSFCLLSAKSGRCLDEITCLENEASIISHRGCLKNRENYFSFYGICLAETVMMLTKKTWFFLIFQSCVCCAKCSENLLKPSNESWTRTARLHIQTLLSCISYKQTNPTFSSDQITPTLIYNLCGCSKFFHSKQVRLRKFEKPNLQILLSRKAPENTNSPSAHRWGQNWAPVQVVTILRLL